METYKDEMMNLIRLGLERSKALAWANKRKDYWTVNSCILNTTITTGRLREAG